MRRIVNDSFEITIGIEDIQACMPYISDVVGDSYVSDVVHIVNEAMDYRAVSVISDDIEFGEEGICIEGVYVRCGSKIVYKLDGSRKVAIVVCSLGQRIMDLYIRFKSEGETLNAYLCDIISNIAIGKLTDAVKAKVYQDEAKPYSWGISMDFSPGDCAWSLEEQKKLLLLFPHGSCPVTLTDSYIMQPLKSLSFIMGLGPGLHGAGNKCQDCNLQQCSYKKQIRWKR